MESLIGRMVRRHESVIRKYCAASQRVTVRAGGL